MSDRDTLAAASLDRASSVFGWQHLARYSGKSREWLDLTLNAIVRSALVGWEPPGSREAGRTEGHAEDVIEHYKGLAASIKDNADECADRLVAERDAARAECDAVTAAATALAEQWEAERDLLGPTINVLLAHEHAARLRAVLGSRAGAHNTTTERNPHLPEAPADGKHVFGGDGRSYRCSRCGVYNRDESRNQPFHTPCEGGWAQSGKMRAAAEDRWAADLRARRATTDTEDRG